MLLHLNHCIVSCKQKTANQYYGVQLTDLQKVRDIIFHLTPETKWNMHTLNERCKHILDININIQLLMYKKGLKWYLGLYYLRPLQWDSLFSSTACITGNFLVYMCPHYCRYRCRHYTSEFLTSVLCWLSRVSATTEAWLFIGRNGGFYIQWNPFKADTMGEMTCVLYMEVPLLRGSKNQF